MKNNQDKKNVITPTAQFTGLKIGDSIRGSRIVAQAMKIGNMNLINRTGSHRGYHIILKRNAYCVIEEPLKICSPLLNTNKTQ